eukprot:03062.XXX_14640_14750_1 [CDS] Oithona nana genome sequencing.
MIKCVTFNLSFCQHPVIVAKKKILDVFWVNFLLVGM